MSYLRYADAPRSSAGMSSNLAPRTRPRKRTRSRAYHQASPMGHDPGPGNTLVVQSQVREERLLQAHDLFELLVRLLWGREGEQLHLDAGCAAPSHGASPKVRVGRHGRGGGAGRGPTLLNWWTRYRPRFSAPCLPVCQPRPRAVINPAADLTCACHSRWMPSCADSFHRRPTSRRKQ